MTRTITVIIFDIVMGLIVLMYALLFTWGTLWFMNIFIYLVSVADIFSSVLFSDTFMSIPVLFIYHAITKGPFYAVPIFYTHNEAITLEEKRINRYIIIGLYVIIVLFVYDVRLTEYLPSPIYEAAKFLQDRCYCYLLGEVDYTLRGAGAMFKGNLGDIQYTVFDLVVIGISLFMARAFPKND